MAASDMVTGDETQLECHQVEICDTQINYPIETVGTTECIEVQPMISLQTFSCPDPSADCVDSSTGKEVSSSASVPCVNLGDPIELSAFVKMKPKTQIHENNDRKDFYIPALTVQSVDLSDPKQLSEFLNIKPKKTVGNTACTYEGCSKHFGSKAAVRKHLKRHYCPRIHVCVKCGKAFFDACTLKRHQLVHTKKKQLQCVFCGKRFALDFNLRIHEKIHTGDRLFVCPFITCYKKFIHQCHLKYHVLTHEKLKENSTVS